MRCILYKSVWSVSGENRTDKTHMLLPMYIVYRVETAAQICITLTHIRQVTPSSTDDHYVKRTYMLVQDCFSRRHRDESDN